MQEFSCWMISTDFTTKMWAESIFTPNTDWKLNIVERYVGRGGNSKVLGNNSLEKG